MKEQTFKRLMETIKFLAHENQDYATGYQRGLRRHYHGEDFGTEAEHRKFMGLWSEGHREDIGRGYRDGFNGLEPDPDNNRNPRNAGRNKLGRINTLLLLDPPVKQAINEYAATHSMSMSTAANILLAEALKLKLENDHV
jgi:hypothetical protein